MDAPNIQIYDKYYCNRKHLMDFHMLYDNEFQTWNQERYCSWCKQACWRPQREFSCYYTCPKCVKGYNLCQKCYPLFDRWNTQVQTETENHSELLQQAHNKKNTTLLNEGVEVLNYTQKIKNYKAKKNEQLEMCLQIQQ